MKGYTNDGKTCVLRENMETVKVYLQCSWTTVAGMSGIAYVGISAQEVLVGCQIVEVPQERWLEVSQGIRVMANAAGPILNAKNARD